MAESKLPLSPERVRAALIFLRGDMESESLNLLIRAAPELVETCVAALEHIQEDHHCD